MDKVKCLIIGAGAAGLHCAGHLNLGPGEVVVVDHATKAAEKIRISGGGRCNFTNLEVEPKRFLSSNQHFCKSALKRYTHWDFITQVATRGIAYHEKTLGQLFCDDSAQQIIDMLLDAAEDAGARIQLDTTLVEVAARPTGGFEVTLEHEGRHSSLECDQIVVASGGLSIPKIGASPLGYNIARQFGHEVLDTRPGLVPLTFSGEILDKSKALSGLSTPTTVASARAEFDEGMLFTHRGLSGPSILQISNYWLEGEEIVIDLAPSRNAGEELIAGRSSTPKKQVKTVLGQILPNRLAEAVCDDLAMQGTMADASNRDLDRLGQRVNRWRIKPAGTEGYRTAEVTLGGVDTNGLSSKTMESQNAPGLYFIGEVVDVTGWLGGYNFQWAWSSAWAAAQAINAKYGTGADS